MFCDGRGLYLEPAEIKTGRYLEPAGRLFWNRFPPWGHFNL